MKTFATNMLFLCFFVPPLAEAQQSKVTGAREIIPGGTQPSTVGLAEWFTGRVASIWSGQQSACAGFELRQ